MFLENPHNRLRRIYEFFQVAVEAGQVLLPLLIVGNEALFLLQQGLTLLLEGLALVRFVLDPCEHEFLLSVGFAKVGRNDCRVRPDCGSRDGCVIIVSVVVPGIIFVRAAVWDGGVFEFAILGEKVEEVIERNEGESLVLVIVGLACGNLAAQMPLFVVEVLEVEVETIDFLTGLGGLLLGRADLEESGAVLLAEDAETREKVLLSLGEIVLEFGRCR